MHIKKKVWDFLGKMKPGERYVINEVCETANREKFIAAIKEWMDQFPYQGGLNFNYDYSEFYKTFIPLSIPSVD